MAGINSIELARSLGIRARLVEDGKYIAMNPDDFFEFEEKQRAKAGWSLDTVTEIMTSTNTHNVSEPPVKKTEEKPVRRNLVFDASQIVVKRVK